MVDPVVCVDGGWVRGKVEDGVAAFLAVPYARSPEGGLRWRAPERPAPWSGVRDARTPGAIAPQEAPEVWSLNPEDPLDQSEDCLHLSVWAPAEHGHARPVMVWIHGGGFASGSAGNAVYRGATLARAAGVVVVAVNYRLGALGFLAHRALAGAPGQAHANWALMDVVAALGWVRDHALLFGGDPSNVTIFGESSGAVCVSTLLAVPSARGLFHKVIVQSGPPYVHSLERAEDLGEQFVRELGHDEVDRTWLEKVPAYELVGALASLTRRPAAPRELPIPLIPAIDGVSLPEHPMAAIARGASAGIASLVGTTRDEVSFFALGDPSALSLDEHALNARVERAAPLGADVGAVIDAYRRVLLARNASTTPSGIWTAAGSDLVFRWPTVQLAAALSLHDARTYCYLFTWETPVFGGALGATHSLDIPFVFGSAGSGSMAAFTGPGQPARALAEVMMASWGAFAHRGDPSSPGTGMWPAWERRSRQTMVLGARCGAQEMTTTEGLEVLERFDPLPGAPRPAGAEAQVAGR